MSNRKLPPLSADCKKKNSAIDEKSRYWPQRTPRQPAPVAVPGWSGGDSMRECMRDFQRVSGQFLAKIYAADDAPRASVHFVVPGTLPGLNEIIAANRSNRFTGAKQKRQAQARIVPFLPRPKSLRYPVNVSIVWHEKDKRRDPDNIMAGTKFILDALVAAGVLSGDSQRYIQSITHSVRTDRKNPRVEVTIEEA